MFKHFFYLLILVVFFSTTHAQQVVFSGAITEFKNCSEFESVSEGSDSYSICEGMAGYEFHVIFDTYTVLYKLQNASIEYDKDLVIDCGEARDYGESAEWRLANNQPFAIIIRYKCYVMEFSAESGFTGTKKGEYYLVQGLSGYDIYKTIDCTLPDALDVARKIADSEYLRLSK